MKSYRLEGIVKLLSPLSHIGESVGPDSYLAEDLIIGPDGQPIECFTYSGNAFRGHLRDLGTKYLLDRLEVKVPLETFHLLFSGGSLGGPQAIDLDQARLYRKVLPLFSILGGGVGNQILAGKLKVGCMYPLVRECQHILPQRLRNPEAPSWRQWTIEKSFTRMDDSKDENLRGYLALPAEDQKLLPGPVEETKEKERPQQMRYTVEMLASGSILYQRIELVDVSELELGAFVSCLWEFQKHPYIGGKSGIGCGQVELSYDYTEVGSGQELQPFLTVGEDVLSLGELANASKSRYDAFLQEMYNRYLTDKAPEIKQILGATA